MSSISERILRGLRRYYFGDEDSPANRDAVQLRALASSFYATGLLGVVFSCVSIPNLFVTLVVVVPSWQNGEVADHRFVVMLAIAAFVFLMSLLLMERLSFFACQCVTQRRRYRYVLAMTWLSALILPVGPFLCVYGLRVLRRQSVRELFGEGMGETAPVNPETCVSS